MRACPLSETQKALLSANNVAFFVSTQKLVRKTARAVSSRRSKRAHKKSAAHRVVLSSSSFALIFLKKKGEKTALFFLSIDLFVTRLYSGNFSKVFLSAHILSFRTSTTMPVTGWLRGTVKAVPSGDTVLIVANAGPTVRVWVYFAHRTAASRFLFRSMLSLFMSLPLFFPMMGRDHKESHLRNNVSRCSTAALFPISCDAENAFADAFGPLPSSLSSLHDRARVRRRRRSSRSRASSPPEWYGDVIVFSSSS